MRGSFSSGSGQQDTVTDTQRRLCERRLACDPLKDHNTLTKEHLLIVLQTSPLINPSERKDGGVTRAASLGLICLVCTELVGSVHYPQCWIVTYYMHSGLCNQIPKISTCY